MKRNSSSISGNQTNSNQSSVCTPVKVTKTLKEIFASTITSSPSKYSSKDVIIWRIMESNTNSFGEPSLEGIVVDGCYGAGLLLATRNKQNLNYENPHEETLESIPIPGTLVKGNQYNNMSIKEMERDAPYLLSSTGETPGSCKVWVYTTYQLLRANKIENITESFDDLVYKNIINFFEKTKRKPLIKDSSGKILNISYKSNEEAIPAYDNAVPWNYKIKTFVLDNESKLDVFAKLATSF